jgi:hypothetical protein
MNLLRNEPIDHRILGRGYMIPDDVEGEVLDNIQIELPQVESEQKLNQVSDDPSDPPSTKS